MSVEHHRTTPAPANDAGGASAGEPGRPTERGKRVRSYTRSAATTDVEESVPPPRKPPVSAGDEDAAFGDGVRAIFQMYGDASGGSGQVEADGLGWGLTVNGEAQVCEVGWSSAVG